MAESSRGLLDDTRSPGMRSTYGPTEKGKISPSTARMLQLAFVGVVALMVLISVILSIYRGATGGSGKGLYFMLGISLIGFAIIVMIMVYFVRKGDLPEDKSWFLYLVGGCVILESIFTDVLLFQ